MKIALASDLHLEFADINLKNDQNADVLLLSGDIMVAADLGRPDPNNIMEGARSNRFRDFFKRVSFQFPHVIYVLGNHEHYEGDFAHTVPKIRAMLREEGLDNVYLLDKEIKVIGDVTFIGGTLWTDMNNEDPLTLYHIKSMMNDFRCVANGDRVVNYKVRVPFDKPVGVTDEEWLVHPHFGRTREVFNTRPATFCPEDAVEDHKKMLGYIQTIIEGKIDEKFVVVGHHAPSKLSTKPRYQNDTLMNGGYSSDLSEYILDHPQIKLWTHGHTHDVFDYMIGSTRVVCNPRGYDGYEDRADRFTLQYYEV
jgi:Icc-related predicted phosphoesterase